MTSTTNRQNGSPAGRPGARTTLPAVLGLLAVTAAWGSTFPLLKDAGTRIPAADYSAVRFALAAVVLAGLRPRGVWTMPAVLQRRAVLLGLAFGAAQLLLTVGLNHTSASVSGFVTGMYVVFTPLLAAVLLRQRISPQIAWAIALATAGLGVLTVQSPSAGASLGVGTGELIVLAGAVVFALHIIGLGAWSQGRYAIEMAVIQAAVTALLCALFALPGGITLPSGRADWLIMVYLAVAVGAITMVLQTWAQSRMHPTRAAVVMTLEPVWAAVFAVLIGGEVLGWRVAVGGAAVLVAMYVCERPAVTADRSRAGGSRRAWRSLPRQRR